jgi:hypothetical protein
VKRIATGSCLTILVFAVTATAFAKSRVVAQRTALVGTTQMYLSAGFVAGHRYRIQAINTHGTIKGYATEHFTYVYKQRLGIYDATVKLSGKSPRTLSITVPSKLRGVNSWLIAAYVSGSNPRAHLTLRFIDLGR